VGLVFGRSRPATGFDIDLKALTINSAVEAPKPARVSAPRDGSGDEAGRWQFIQSLRRSGYVVIEGETDGCEWRISNENGDWKLVEQR